MRRYIQAANQNGEFSISAPCYGVSIEPVDNGAVYPIDMWRSSNASTKHLVDSERVEYFGEPTEGMRVGGCEPESEWLVTVLEKPGEGVGAPSGLLGRPQRLMSVFFDGTQAVNEYQLPSLAGNPAPAHYFDVRRFRRCLLTVACGPPIDAGGGERVVVKLKLVDDGERNDPYGITKTREITAGDPAGTLIIFEAGEGVPEDTADFLSRTGLRLPFLQVTVEVISSNLNVDLDEGLRFNLWGFP